MIRPFRLAFVVLFVTIVSFSQFTGCATPCSYPEQLPVKIRMLNAMPDMPKITIFINGKLFLKDYTYEPPANFGYTSTFADGSPLVAGDSELFVITSDASGKDTLVSAHVLIDFHRQTVIAMGRGHIKPPQPKTALIIRLDDEADPANREQTLIRFVNAVPDLDSLDLYYKGDTVGKPLGKPDATIRYGAIYRHIILNSVSGLTVTEAGHPNNVVFTIGYPFAFPGFFITTIVRGESKPIGKDYTAAPLVLSDAIVGNYLFPFRTFAVRLVNATRIPKLSLLIRSTYVVPQNIGPPRANYPNQQNTVLNIGSGVISEYLAMNPALDSISTYWISKSENAIDTLVSSTDGAKANCLFSKIAIEENVFGQTNKLPSYLSLLDTMTNPVGNFGRLRVINLSPDHASIQITAGGQSYTLVRKQILFLDLPSGQQTVTLKEGSTTMSKTITVKPARPTSLYLMPETSVTTTFPISSSDD